MSDETEQRDWKADTLAVHAGEPRPPVDGAVVQPIFQSATYLDGEAGSYDEVRYIRLNNTPNHEATAAKIAALEGTEAGLVAGSGMGAIVTALLSVAGRGDHVLAQDCLYGGTRAFLETEAPRLGLDVDFVSLEDPGSWESALRPSTRAFHVETLSNPLMEVGRLDEVAAFCRSHGVVSLIDNTFATPLGCQPARLGFDLVLHSATKYLGGHSDIVAGALLGSRQRVAEARRVLNLMGATLDPHACFLLQRGLKTLPLRFRAQCATACRLAADLDGHPAVDRVMHPSLPRHGSHARARRLLELPGAMIAFVPRGGLEAAERILGRLTLPLVAPSLGGVESLVTRPAATSHAGLSPERRAELGIPDEMIRISVGVEHPDDLLADFRQALGE